MVKAFFWGGLTLILILIGLPSAVRAAEGDCHLKYCFVPAPTTYTPQANETASARPAITGLTWKTTIVKVYVDGIELAGVQQVKHEDYYGSFYAKPAFNLAPGRHYVYTIAHSENPSAYGQSKESVYTYFTVPEPVESEAVATAEAALPIAEAEIVDLESGPTIGVVETDLGFSVEVERGRIEGGVAVEAEPAERMVAESAEEPKEIGLQETASFEELTDVLEGGFKEQRLQDRLRQNRVIGLSILGLAIIIIIIWIVISKNSIKSQFKKESVGDLPPPPRPPAGRNQPEVKADEPVSVKDEEIKLEPVAEEPGEDQAAMDSLLEREMDYWASPPPSPYTPYPPIKEDEDRLDRG